MPYDRLGDSTEECTFLYHYRDLLKSPDITWHFDKDELYEIAVIYLKLLKGAGVGIKEELPIESLSMVFHKGLGMADNSLMQRIFAAGDHITSTCSLKAWISLMSLFLRGSIDQKIKFCFKVYDLNSKLELKRDLMVKLLKTSVYMHLDEDVEEAVKDLADIIIKKMDVDRDGIISIEDYHYSVKKDPMLLECLGQCLPDRKNVNAFLTTFTDKIKDF